MKKKFLLTVVALSLIIFAFSGCKGGGSASDSDGDSPSVGDSSQTTTDDSETSESEAEPVTLKFFVNSAAAAGEPLDDIVAEYERRNPHVTIEVVEVPSADFNMKVDTMLASGEQLDIVYFSNMPAYAPRAMQGAFYPLDDFLAEEGVELLDIYSIDCKVDDGKIYALPGDVKMWVVWLNKDDLDKAGLPVPPLDWTWDDYREYAKKLTWGDGTDKHYGSMWVDWDHYNVFYAYNKFDGNPYINRDGTHNLNDPAFRESVELRYNLEQVDQTQIPLAEVQAMQLDYRTVFFSGRASMLPMATNIIPHAQKLDEYPHDFVTTFATLPIPEGGREGYTYADNRFYSIGKSSVNPKEAYKFIRFLTTEGIPMKNTTFTAERVQTVPMDEMVDRMTSQHPELFDKDALKNVLNNPALHLNAWDYVPSYSSEIVNLFWAEADKTVMGEISIDELFDNVIPQVETILEQNKDS